MLAFACGESTVIISTPKKRNTAGALVELCAAYLQPEVAKEIPPESDRLMILALKIFAQAVRLSAKQKEFSSPIPYRKICFFNKCFVKPFLL